MDQSIVEGDALLIQANREKNKENIAEAIQLYEQALEKKGNKAPIYFELAQLYYDYQRNYALALSTINKALDLDDHNKWYLFFFLKINEENGNSAMVEKGYRKLINLYPDYTEYQLQFADYYITRKQYEKALGIYDEIENRFGPSIRINRNKFLIHKGKKRYPAAVVELEKVIQLDPTEERNFLDLVDLQRLMGDEIKAEQTYLDAIFALPNATGIKDEYGHFLFLKNRTDSAYDYHKEVLLDEYYEVRYKANIIDLYLKYERLDPKYEIRRLQLCHYLDSLHNDDFLANQYLGELAARKEQFEIARKHFGRAVELQPNSFDSWQNLMLTDQHLRDDSLLLIHSKAALIYFPAQAQLYLYKGSAHLGLKQYEQAIEALEEGLVLANGKGQRLYFHISLGDAYHNVKAHADSDGHFEKALAIDSTNALVLNNYAYYLSERNERLKEALEMSRRSNILSPGNASYNDTYGWILFLLQDFEAGLEWLLKAERNGGENSAVILEHIGDVYKERGELEQARFYYQKAVDAGGNQGELSRKMNML